MGFRMLDRKCQKTHVTCLKGALISNANLTNAKEFPLLAISSDG